MHFIFDCVHWGLKKSPFTLYDYILAKILQNGANFIQKLNYWFKKSHEEFEQIETSSG